MVVRVEGNASISMFGFAIQCGGQAVTILGHKIIHEYYPALLLLFHGELDVWRLLIEVSMEPGQFFITLLPDDKGVNHIASPNGRLGRGEEDGMRH